MCPFPTSPGTSTTQGRPELPRGTAIISAKWSLLLGSLVSPPSSLLSLKGSTGPTSQPTAPSRSGGGGWGEIPQRGRVTLKASEKIAVWTPAPPAPPPRHSPGWGTSRSHGVNGGCWPWEVVKGRFQKLTVRRRTRDSLSRQMQSMSVQYKGKVSLEGFGKEKAGSSRAGGGGRRDRREDKCPGSRKGAGTRAVGVRGPG